MPDPLDDQIARLQGQIDTQTALVTDIVTEAAASERELSAAEQTQITASQETVDGLAAMLSRVTDFQASRVAAERLRTTPSHASRQTSGVTVGSQLCADAGWSQWAQSGRGMSPSVRVDTALATIVTTSGSGKALQEPGTAVISGLSLAGIPLLEAINMVPVGPGPIHAISVSLDDTSAANPDAAVVGEGADKPEVTMLAVEQELPAQAIAGWVQVSRQALSDQPMMRSIIDQRLARSVRNRMAAEAIRVIKAATLPSVTASKAAQGTMMSLIRAAIGEAQLRGGTDISVLLSPEDWASIDVELLGTITGGAALSKPWGATVVPTRGLSAGTCYVGDLREAVDFYIRDALTIYATDSDIVGAGSTAKSAFRSNVITILGEIRGAAAVIDPNVLVKGTLAA